MRRLICLVMVAHFGPVATAISVSVRPALWVKLNTMSLRYRHQRLCPWVRGARLIAHVADGTDQKQVLMLAHPCRFLNQGAQHLAIQATRSDVRRCHQMSWFGSF